MAFSKVSESVIRAAGVTPLPDSPQLQPAQLKQKFDEKGDIALTAFNNHIDELSATTAAGNIGGVVPTGYQASANVQSILTVLAAVVKQNTDKRHTHDNKALLDSITSEDITNDRRIIALLQDITSVATSITNTNASIPTSAAVENYVYSYDYATRLRDIFYPVHTVYYTTGTQSPASTIGGTWRQISTEGNVRGWERTA